MNPEDNWFVRGLLITAFPTSKKKKKVWQTICFGNKELHESKISFCVVQLFNPNMKMYTANQVKDRTDRSDGRNTGSVIDKIQQERLC